MRSLLTLLSLMVLTITCEAQVVKRIKKGRRYKSESQFALNKNDFQAEWEIGKETIDSQLTTIIYPNLILHYALSDRLEVNTEMSCITAKNNAYSNKQKTTGLEPVLIGANYQVLRDNDNSPSVIISAQLAIPFLSTKAFTINYLSPVLQVNVQEALHKQWIFGLSGGLLWDGYATTPNFTYNATTSYYYKNRWMITAECFGFINHDMVQNNLDASVAYTINDLVQFGITAGTGISTFAPKNYFAVNGTWGFNTSKKSYAH